MKRLIWNRHTKLLLKHVFGWFCIVAGVVMLITPGQGILSILIGVFVLSNEIPLFGRFKAWIEHKFPKMAAYVHRTGETLKTRFHKNPQP